MRYFISGLMAIFLIGCSSFLKFDKPEIPVAPPESVQSEPDLDEEDSSVHDDPAKPLKRKAPIPQHPLEIKKSDAPAPCRDIADEDLWQALRLKWYCIEENVK